MMNRMKSTAFFIISFLFLAGFPLLAEPVVLNMDNLEQIGEMQSHNNNDLQDAITLTGLDDLQFAGGEFNTAYLWVWNQGEYWWGGSEPLTHLSIKAGNNWILYELDQPMQTGWHIQLTSEIFNKNGKPKDISHVTGYYSPSSTSVPEPATLLLGGLGLAFLATWRRFGL